MIFLGVRQRNIAEWAMCKPPGMLNYNLYWYKRQRCKMKWKLASEILTHPKNLRKIEYLITDSSSVMVRKKKSHRLIKFAIFKTWRFYKTSEMVAWS